VVYLDTNVLIYASVDQDKDKKDCSLQLLRHLIDSKRLMLSSLVLQEFVFTMAKLKVDHEIIQRDSDFYAHFIGVDYDHVLLQKSIRTCCKLNTCKNINDISHLYLAYKAKCNKLITFDSDFKKFDALEGVEIDIL
jgi:predicted nucleic acid-binding protein